MFQTDKNLQEFSYQKIENLSEKRVVVRSGLNVAVDKEGKVTDATRLYESLPLIKELAGRVKRLVILGHLGRPEAGKFEQAYSFWNVAEIMGQELAKESSMLKLKLAKKLSEITDEYPNTIYLLENIRFFESEEAKDLEKRVEFGKELAKLGDVFVNDSFADYREAASTFEITKHIPSYLGPVFLREVEALSKLTNPNRPFVAVLGGAKLSEKLDVLKAICEVADKVLIGGAMSYTLLKSQGIDIGRSLVEEDKLEVASEIMNKFRDKLVLPVDHKVVNSLENLHTRNNYAIIHSQEVNPNNITVEKEFSADSNQDPFNIAVDIGPETLRIFIDEIKNAKTILWNGPMGIFEWEYAEWGTKNIGKAIVENHNAYKLAGGGDSIVAINEFKLEGFTHISTGGGAMLAFIAYNKFPTLEVILENSNS